MKPEFILCSCKLFISPYHAFDLTAVYYELVRRTLNGDKSFDFVDEHVDIGVIMRLANAVPDADARAFREIFGEWFPHPEPNVREYDGPGSDIRAELKALLICYSIALMNVEDKDGKEEAELIPFILALKKEKYEESDETKLCFDQSLQCFAWILFGIPNSEVSSLTWATIISIPIF